MGSKDFEGGLFTEVKDEENLQEKLHEKGDGLRKPKMVTFFTQLNNN